MGVITNLIFFLSYLVRKSKRLDCGCKINSVWEIILAQPLALGTPGLFKLCRCVWARDCCCCAFILMQSEWSLKRIKTWSNFIERPFAFTSMRHEIFFYTFKRGRLVLFATSDLPIVCIPLNQIIQHQCNESSFIRDHRVWLLGLGTGSGRFQQGINRGWRGYALIGFQPQFLHQIYKRDQRDWFEEVSNHGMYWGS